MITLSIIDLGDSVYDSTVFIDNVRVGFVANPAQNCVPGAQVANFTLGLTPETATHAIGTSHTATISLHDDAGNPIANADVVVTRSGANPGFGHDHDERRRRGDADLHRHERRYYSLSATYDADGNGSAEATDSASVTWENRYALTPSLRRRR